MTKNLIKRSLSLMAVVFMMVLMSVPVFASSACSYTAKSTDTGNGGILYKMYGAIPYDTSAKDGCSYSITITDYNGSSVPIYLEQRPDVNDVKVSMGTDGTLNVYGMGSGDANTWNQFFTKYKAVIVGISGIGAITFIALFIIQFMKLGASAGNPQARSQALSGCLWTGLAAAALGAVSIIAGFFYNAV